MTDAIPLGYAPRQSRLMLQRNHIQKFLLWTGLLLTLLLFAVGSSRLDFGHWTAPRVLQRSPPPPVIPPGREKLVMTFLGPVLKNGFTGLEISNISLVKSEIRLQLAQKKDSATTTEPPCPLPAWARAPGSLVILPERAPAPECSPNTACDQAKSKDLVFVWAVCSSKNTAAEAASQWMAILSGQTHDGIWESPSEPVTSVEPPTIKAGLLTPIVELTRGDAVFVSLCVLLGSLLMTVITALILRWRMKRNLELDGGAPASSPTNEPRFWNRQGVCLGIFLAVGIVLRVRAAVLLPLDSDEQLGGDYLSRTLANDHDAWVHPPLYRALHQECSELLGLSSESPVWQWRIPSLSFSILALGFLAITLRTMKLPARAEIPLAIAALSPIAVENSVLARPYGLAMFGATLVLVALNMRHPSENEQDDWFSWFVALMALGLTVWTDLVTALLVGSFVLARWLHRASFSGRSTWTERVVTAMTVVSWVLPFAVGLPGAARASKELGWPFRAEPTVISAFDQCTAFFWHMLGMFTRTPQPGFTLGLVAIIGTAVFVVHLRKAVKTSAALGFGLMLVLLAITSNRIGMRTRNVVFLPIACSFVTSLLVARALARPSARSGTTPRADS